MQTLFTSDRMIVKGYQWQYTTAVSSDNPLDWNKKVCYLNLEFIFQVNGKMTIFSCDQYLTWDRDYISNKSNSLIDWHSWNAICELFFSMGYKFNEWLTPYYGVINEWIEKTDPWLYENATVENCT